MILTFLNLLKLRNNLKLKIYSQTRLSQRVFAFLYVTFALKTDQFGDSVSVNNMEQPNANDGQY